MKLADFDFRIWDTENRKYVNENYAKNYHCVGIVKWFENFLGETQDFNKNEFFGFQFFNRDKGDCGGFNTTENAEIELWTGIRDKNGKKIYEGDIIKISPKEAYIKQRLKENPFYLKGATLLVEFHIKDTFGFCFWGNEEKTGKALHPLDFWHKLYHYKEFGEDFEIEILGNIHENADLLGKDKE